MEFHLAAHITLRSSILDPQGKATQRALSQLGFGGVKEVRIGKLVELHIEAGSEAEARDVAEAACRKLLANEVMEDFTLQVKEVEAA